MEILLSLALGAFVGWFLTIEAIYSQSARDLKKSKREYDKLMRELAEDSCAAVKRKVLEIVGAMLPVLLRVLAMRLACVMESI